MKISSCLLAAPLLLAASLARAQAPATPDDSLKGRIWTATAQRIWADTKPRAAQPAPWPTNAAFTNWLSTAGKNEKSGIGLLRGDVVRQLGTGRPATGAQVAQAILAEAAAPPQSRAWLQKLDVPALRAALQQLTPLAGAAPAASQPAPGAAPTSLATNDSTLAAPFPAATATTTSSKGFFARNPLLTAVLGALAGALLMYGLVRTLRRRSRHRHRHSSDSLSSPIAMPSPLQDSTEVLRLQNEVQRLAHYIKELEAKLLHYENANAADVALGASEPEPVLEAAVPPAELPHEPATAPAEASPARYGPVQETPCLDDRKIVDDPLPQLALMLTLDPQQPEQASFTLNPHVNQSMLIGDGLNRLAQFFDYEAPLGRISLVEGAAPGLLQRQGEGWQVVERGWLNIS